MYINSIELVNYCQHAHRRVYITGNLIAVVGHNGVGKSNLLGALQFALTGEQPGKNRADLLSWGAKEGHVVLEFTQDGKPGRIERSVSSNDVTLEYDGTVTSGITNVAREIKARLNMDKDIGRQSVFVRQTEVDAVISSKTDKRDREVAFQRLIGIDAAKVHKYLTDWLYAADKPVNYDFQLTETAQKISDTEARMSALEADVEAAKVALEEFGEVDESQSANLSRAIAAVSAVLQAKTALQTCGDAVLVRAAALSQARAAVESAGADPGFHLAELAAQTAALKDEIRKLDVREAAERALALAMGARKATLDTPHATEDQIAQMASDADAIQTELAAVRSGKAMLTKPLSSLTGAESVCPVCGKPLDAGMVERMRFELAELCGRETGLSAKLREVQAKAEQARRDLAAWRTAAAVDESRLKSAQEALDAADTPQLDRATAAAALAKAQADAQTQTEYDRRAGALKQAVSSAELQLDVAARAKEDAERRLADAEAEARKLCGDEAAADWTQARAAMESLVAETDRRRARHTELQMAEARAVATRDEAARALASLRGSMESLRAAQAEQDRLAARLAVIGRVRDWFHYANGPRILVTQALEALTDDVNRSLGNFTAPFVVVPDREQLGFKVKFVDGRSHPAEPLGTDVLSGGERVQLAVAFRLAVYAMFAGKLGLLSLDEPTAYLDDGNVDRFGVLLAKVGTMASSSGTQVFMATHERAVIPYMDSVIDLN